MTTDKEHRAAQMAEHYEKNKGHILAKQAAWKEKNQSHVKVQGAAYYQKNKARIKAHAAAYRENHKGRVSVYRVQNKENQRENQRAYHAKYLRTLRLQFYDMYGVKKEGHEHGVCSCPACGADLMLFGTVSHIDGSGKQHRESAGNHLQMLREATAAYNPTRFAAECFNCNLAAARNGGICPHKNKIPLTRLRGREPKPDYHMRVAVGENPGE